VSDPFVGRTIAHYEVVARVGGGAMGVVYQARDTKLGRLVALKFLPQQWSHDETAKQRFVREAQAASATNHPNICTIHDIETAADGQLFIVMAFYEGRTLKQRLESGQVAIDEALEIATQIADGLAKAHAQGVVHRDIKPGNVILTEEGVRILDFGLAMFADALQLTVQNSTLGTVAYMSPEQIRGETVDARSDVWAAGVVLYEMLVGHVPFRGTHAEAIGYAIRNDAPTPLRSERPEIPEDVEQLVFRALHKDRSVRFSSGRELARALRQVRGLTLPVTESVSVPKPGRQDVDKNRSHARIWAGVAAALIVSVAGALTWTWWPIERIPVAIVPVVNQTGYSELDAYRLALTQIVVMEVSDSPNVRVTPYGRLQQLVRPFLARGIDVSSREAAQVIAAQTGARFLIVPTLTYQNGAWRGRAEIQDAATATNTDVVETGPIASSLPNDTAYALAIDLALRVQEYFRTNGPGRSYVPRSSASRFRSLAAAKLFEEGISAYDELEYDAAQRFFSQARTLDSRNPLVAAWLSRVERILRQDESASAAAEDAVRLLSATTSALDAALVNAIAAEARSDFASAESRYRSLVTRHPDESLWRIELGAFQDRRGANEAAVVSYQQALSMDAGLAQPEVELCRLYNRLNDRANARKHAEQGLRKFTALGARWGEAQALFCLTDVLRVGTTSERREARRHADAARAILEALKSTYNLPRAFYYSGLGLAEQGDLLGGIGLWEKAAATAKSAHNRVLEALLLMNLGVAHARLGNRRQAMDYYRQSSNAYQALGEEARAAQIQINRAQLRIDFGDGPDEAFRDVQNALAVFVQNGDRNWQVFSRQTLASFYRHGGRYADAEQELNRALAIARERNLSEDIASLTVDLARTRFAVSDYPGSLKHLEAVGDDAGQHTLHAWIWLGRAYSRLGDVANARQLLQRAETEVNERTRSEYTPLLHLALGELEYESNRLEPARRYFEKASAGSNDDLSDPASVEARAWLGLIDTLERRTTRPRAAVEASLTRAVQLRHVALEARCRIILARVLLNSGDHAGAASVVGNSSGDGTVVPGSELLAQMHYWRGRAHAALGEMDASRAESARAKELLDVLRNSLPDRYRESFSMRPDIGVAIR
jgi:tetratricopeptide (TPR) repeat protein